MDSDGYSGLVDSRRGKETDRRSVPGKPASLVILREAACVDEDVWSGLLSTLAPAKGSLTAVSTPHGNTGQFFEI